MKKQKKDLPDPRILMTRYHVLAEAEKKKMHLRTLLQRAQEIREVSLHALCCYDDLAPELATAMLTRVSDTTIVERDQALELMLSELRARIDVYTETDIEQYGWISLDLFQRILKSNSVVTLLEFVCSKLATLPLCTKHFMVRGYVEMGIELAERVILLDLFSDGNIDDVRFLDALHNYIQDCVEIITYVHERETNDIEATIVALMYQYDIVSVLTAEQEDFFAQASLLGFSKGQIALLSGSGFLRIEDNFLLLQQAMDAIREYFLFYKEKNKQEMSVTMQEFVCMHLRAQGTESTKKFLKLLLHWQQHRRILEQ